MLRPGIYPASVTPMTEDGSPDHISLARLLAYFEHAGCQGAVLAGTNGEGPSLSAVQKRDLLRAAEKAKGSLDLILGVATSSLHEAHWLTSQAGKNGAKAILLMAPGYFRRAEQDGIRGWLLEVLDKSPLPVIIYQFPQMAGVDISPETILNLAEHPMFAGVKDSSGREESLKLLRDCVPHDKCLFMGCEPLLAQALKAGWTGAISGCANSVPTMMVEAFNGDNEAKQKLLLPVFEQLRSFPQPENHKALLTESGVIDGPWMSLPLTERSDIKAADLSVPVG
jgi:dihydrodipicolinate synthase/N-acetylneuraminate lyase